MWYTYLGTTYLYFIVVLLRRPVSFEEAADSRMCVTSESWRSSAGSESFMAFLRCFNFLLNSLSFLTTIWLDFWYSLLKSLLVNKGSICFVLAEIYLLTTPSGDSFHNFSCASLGSGKFSSLSSTSSIIKSGCGLLWKFFTSSTNSSLLIASGLFSKSGKFWI